MRKTWILIWALAASSTIFAQSTSTARERSDETSNPEIDNLSGVKGDIGVLAPASTTGGIENGTLGTSGTGMATDEYNVGSIKSGTFQMAESPDPIDQTKIYPNPATDFIEIETAVDFGYVRILNLLGQELLSFYITGNTAHLDISSLEGGIYFVSIESGDSKIVKKLKVLY
ncbi:MAG: T9SS type A sorting domain-containing protein [Chitinophagales bacterium]